MLTRIDKIVRQVHKEQFKKKKLLKDSSLEKFNKLGECDKIDLIVAIAKHLMPNIPIRHSTTRFNFEVYFRDYILSILIESAEKIIKLREQDIFCDDDDDMPPF